MNYILSVTGKNMYPNFIWKENTSICCHGLAVESIAKLLPQLPCCILLAERHVILVSLRCLSNCAGQIELCQ